MSAVLDTIRTFSDTLSNELASAVKEQETVTLQTLNDVQVAVDDAKASFLKAWGDIEGNYTNDVLRALENRKEACDHIIGRFAEEISRAHYLIDALREQIADTPAPVIHLKKHRE
jgi:hypothetical protein